MTLRPTTGLFKNRKDAAEKLAHALGKYRNTNALVLGIPRGGAETAYYVAKYLNAELALVITRKLGYPFNPEAAFGAVAEDGSVYISETARETITTDEMNDVLEQERVEIQRRIQKLRRNKPLPNLKGRTVIITDDGIATGATVLATIALCKKSKSGKIVVAAPIASRQINNILSNEVDDVIILEMPSFYTSVSQGYEDFYNLTDHEALAFVDKWEKEHLIHPD